METTLPPAATVSLVTTAPGSTTKVPPLMTSVVLATPPDNTSSNPPLRTAVPMTVAPEENKLIGAAADRHVGRLRSRQSLLHPARLQLAAIGNPAGAQTLDGAAVHLAKSRSPTDHVFVAAGV